MLSVKMHTHAHTFDSSHIRCTWMPKPWCARFQDKFWDARRLCRVVTNWTTHPYLFRTLSLQHSHLCCSLRLQVSQGRFTTFPLGTIPSCVREKNVRIPFKRRELCEDGNIHSGKTIPFSVREFPKCSLWIFGESTSQVPLLAFEILTSSSLQKHEKEV